MPPATSSQRMPSTSPRRAPVSSSSRMALAACRSGCLASALVRRTSSSPLRYRLAELSLKQYYLIDKSGRSNCFATESDLAAVSAEADNQIRNASHHGGMEFDASTQIITYRAGKGGTGSVQRMSYTQYLVRCVRLFMQIINILQL